MAKLQSKGVYMEMGAHYVFLSFNSPIKKGLFALDQSRKDVGL